jgi:hypothetical protein
MKEKLKTAFGYAMLGIALPMAWALTMYIVTAKRDKIKYYK